MWWYVDALSDDGRHGLTIIALLGSVFSPYYAWAREKGSVDPRAHVALNVALYGNPGARWSMTERGRNALSVAPDRLGIGPSSMRWENGGLTIDIVEMAVPIPRPIRGRVRLIPHGWNAQDFALDADGRHWWGPVLPSARVEVELSAPRLSWSGEGYLDSNHGAEPLEKAFRVWDWSRTPLPGGDTVVFYDLIDRRGRERALSLRFRPDGVAEPFPPPPRAALPPILWRVPRATRGEPERPARIVRTLEDTPFYARSIVASRLAGADVVGVHESLDLDRFSRRWVQVLLPFRMPRRGG